MPYQLMVIFFCFVQFVNAQSIDHNLIGNAGESQTISGEVLISWSIGEPLSTNFSAGSTHLTQGLQQGSFVMPLPVTLFDFDAYRINKEWVQLDWSAEGDDLFHGFSIERRLIEEDSFKAIHWVDKHQEIDYSLLDQNNSSALSYYRLKMMDIDGSFEYAPIKAIEGLDTKVNIIAFPNPVVNDLTIRFHHFQENQTYTVQVYNTVGALIYSKPIENLSQYRIKECQSWTRGLYFLKITADSQTLFNQSILLE